MEKIAESTFTWGVSTMTHPGHLNSGDEHLVQTRPDGILIAAVDGLGHGDAAARAAHAAISVVQDHAEMHVIPLMRLCHERLQGSRGVVMSVASLDVRNSLLTWLGIGNVEGVLLRSNAKPGLSPERLLLRAGVVGVQMPPLQAAVLPLTKGDTLIFTTDGVRAEFSSSISPLEDPQRAAERILSRHRKGTDDALVLVARFLGERI